MKKIGVFSILFIALNIYLISVVIGKNRFVLQENVPISTQSGSNQIKIPLVSKELPGYYISPNGSDSNPGTRLKPWKTIRKAALIVKPGDTVYLLGGIYIESVRFDISGTESNPIKIMAYPGETPIIDGQNQLPPNYAGLVSVFGNWVQVSGLEVRNSKYIGLGLYGKHDSANNIFAHHSQKSGIYIGGDFGVVENSRIWRNSLQHEFGNGSSWSSGLIAGRDTTDGLTEYAIMRKNIIWENWGQGINTYESNQTKMEDNISHDNSVTNIYISDSTNVLCQRNFVYMTPGSIVHGIDANVGIMMGDEVYTPSSANIKVINNISFGNNLNFALWKGTQQRGMNDVLIANNTFVNGIETGGVVIRGYHQYVRFENNIVQQDGPLPVIAIDLDPDVSFSNNLWSKTPPSEVLSPGDVIGDPKLAQTGEPYEPDWFRLTDQSPAIDKAQIISEIVNDYFGTFRGGYPDIGAIEYFPVK